MTMPARTPAGFTVVTSTWPAGLDEPRRSAFSRRSGFRRLNGSLAAAARTDPAIGRWEVALDDHGLHSLVAGTLERTWLRTCSACAQAGCHLWLHQSHLFERCPWHDAPLTVACRHCGLPFMQRVTGRRPVDACSRCRQSAFPDPCSWATLPVDDPAEAANARWTRRTTHWATHPRYGTHRSVQVTRPALLAAMLAAYDRSRTAGAAPISLANADGICIVPEVEAALPGATVGRAEWRSHVRAIARRWQRQCPRANDATGRARRRVALEDWRRRHGPRRDECGERDLEASPVVAADRSTMRLALHALWVDGLMSWHDARSVYWRRAHVRWAHLRVGEPDGTFWHVLCTDEPEPDDCVAASMVHVP